MGEPRRMADRATVDEFEATMAAAKEALATLVAYNRLRSVCGSACARSTGFAKYLYPSERAVVSKAIRQLDRLRYRVLRDAETR